MMQQQGSTCVDRNSGSCGTTCQLLAPMLDKFPPLQYPVAALGVCSCIRTNTKEFRGKKKYVLAPNGPYSREARSHALLVFSSSPRDHDSTSRHTRSHVGPKFATLLRYCPSASGSLRGGQAEREFFNQVKDEDVINLFQ